MIMSSRTAFAEVTKNAHRSAMAIGRGIEALLPKADPLRLQG
jgi:hypothetical protein